MTVIWANQILCLISKFERSCRKKKYVRDDGSLGQQKFVFDFKIRKKLWRKRNVRDDGSLGQPKFVFDFKIQEKL